MVSRKALRQDETGYAHTEGPRPTSKRKRRWPWVLLALAVMIPIGVGVGASGGGTSTGGADTETQAPATDVVSLAVTTEGSGRAANSISWTWMNDSGMQQAQEQGPVTPWASEQMVGSGFMSGGVTLTAQAGQGQDSITCELRKGDEVVTNTSTGQYAVVTCSLS